MVPSLWAQGVSVRACPGLVVWTISMSTPMLVYSGAKSFACPTSDSVHPARHREAVENPEIALNLSGRVDKTLPVGSKAEAKAGVRNGIWLKFLAQLFDDLLFERCGIE